MHQLTNASTSGEDRTYAPEVRDADVIELDQLAELWYNGWQDAHASILPAELAQHRTLKSFRQRLVDHLVHARVLGPLGRPVGFCIVKQDELYQFYLSAEARGSGIAAALLADGERRLAASGTTTAWLACAIGNVRAMRFYEKNGWALGGQMVSELEIPGGIYRLDVQRYEKNVDRLIA